MRGRGKAVLFVAVALIVLAVYLTGLGLPFSDGDEAIYAEHIAAMHRSGNYFALEYQGVELMQRPPTSVTLYALVARVVPGSSGGEFGARLLPVLFGMAIFVWAGALIWRITGRVSAGLLTLLVLAAVPNVFQHFRLVLSDPPFVLATFGALLATMAAQREPRLLAWAAAGLGLAFATKSLAAAVPALALAPWLAHAAWRHRGQGARPIVIALGVFLIFAAPYYLIGFATRGSEFWQAHFAVSLLDRAAGDLGPLVGLGGPLSYAGYLWSADGPMVVALLLAGLGITGFRGFRERRAELGVLVTYCVLAFVILSALGTRLAHYLLIVYPGAALCVGLGFAYGCERLGKRAFFLAIAGPGAAALLFMSTMSSTQFASPPAVHSKALGEVARDLVPADAAVYTLNWYAPAFGYYAERRWHFLLGNRDMARVLASVDPFRYTKNVHPVPPFPRGEIFVVGRASELAELFYVSKRLVQVGPYSLVKARAKEQ